MKDIKNFTESIISHYDMTDEKLKEINNKLIQIAIKDKLEVLEGGVRETDRDDRYTSKNGEHVEKIL